MFDIGFSEILVIFILALIVLGPEKLPRVVREVGRWVGRARAMARQFQEQLEEEVDADRNRTIRPQPVRPVGGATPSTDPPPVATSSPVTPEHPEPMVSNGAAPWHTAADPQSEAAISSGDRPAEALTPGTHE
jgi:sec-independent protein translocase protein TatB